MHGGKQGTPDQPLGRQIRPSLATAVGPQGCALSIAGSIVRCSRPEPGVSQLNHAQFQVFNSLPVGRSLLLSLSEAKEWRKVTFGCNTLSALIYWRNTTVEYRK